MKTYQRSFFILGVMLFSLTVVFMFDDVLFYLLFERLFGWQLSLLAKIGIGAIILLLNLGLALLVLRALSEKPQTGSESMVGERGVVDSVASPFCWVKVRGELWRAKSNENLDVGDKVVVRKLEGLTLEVERDHTTSNGGAV
jgi:membrane-bound serine protease (ClpP class)